MPSRKKSSMFACSFCACVGSFVLTCVVLATPRWASSELRFARAGSNLTISLSYGLFRGTCEQFVDVGLQVPKNTFQVADALSSSSSSRSLNIATIVLLVLALLSSLLSSGFTCTNAVSNPYQTFLGPVGVYTWNSLCGVLILLAMILFPVNVEGNRLPVDLAPEGCSTQVDQEKHLGSKHSYGYSYWIMLLILFLNIASLTIIYFYDHATYSKKKEQERPIENAPKDVILF